MAIDELPGSPLPAGGFAYDEMVDGHGSIRPHWEGFLAHLMPSDTASMARREEETRRLLHQHGVSYTVYSDPQGATRPWPLDPVPLILPAEEFRGLAQGMRERARLIETVLQDIYGDGRLLKEGHIPPALLYDNPYFLRPLVGSRLHGPHLAVYSADLARMPNGKWSVLSDRLQNASGLGYTLENRVVTGRVLANQFQESRVMRLNQPFDDILSHLLHLAPQADGKQGHLVLMTPGPLTETYFEHVFLARRLGITLAEGGDLTVRDGRVWLKTLQGLEPVSAVLRRVDEDFCDPLELRPDSALGVAGLVQAIRSGEVLVANGLGVGALEAPGLLALLDRFAGILGVERPCLSAPEMVWLAQTTRPVEFTLPENGWLIRPALSHASTDAIDPAALPEEERTRLAAAVKAAPHRYVAQRRFPLASTPCWINGSLEARPYMLRLYAIARPDGEYDVIPGGLVRYSASADAATISMQKGSGSKDCWILSDESEPGITSSRAPRLYARSTALPSRAADGLFWLGRYIERADSAIRTLRAGFSRLIDDGWPGANRQLEGVLAVMAYIAMINPDFAKLAPRTPLRTLKPALVSAAFNRANTFSLERILANVRRTAASVRDHITADMWRVLADLKQAPDTFELMDDAECVLRLEECATALTAFVGFQQESLPRGDSWHFLDTGRRMERILGLTAILRASGVIERDDADLCQVVLELGDSALTYRARSSEPPRFADIAPLFISEIAHPRSAAFQLQRLYEHLIAVARDEAGLPEEVEALLALTSANRHAAWTPGRLSSVALALEQGVLGLSDRLSATFFAHAGYATRRRRQKLEIVQ
ncbi:circularly permuted type 2 ATP-grasp protein [Radicibacter daui]|uniref:circularly permuted type 2 ATP-grasp protein n=1 Tax=Radicibacter daui TaxID=3064829 RepID=UPI00404688DD